MRLGARGLLLLSAMLLMSCAAGPEPAPFTDSGFDWTLGQWQGVRRSGADGSEAPMSMKVIPVLGGQGQLREIEVAHEGGAPYRGVALQLREAGSKRWVRTYANAVRGRFVRLEGDGEGVRSTWRTVAPGRSRESRLLSVLGEDGTWTRTMEVSEDGGANWRVLWIDVLRRAD